MTEKEFFQAVSKSEVDILQVLLDIFKETDAAYCIVGGLAVNAYVDPIVSLDLDVVVVAGKRDAICELAKSHGFRIEDFPHSINLTAAKSGLRIQFQTDERYQAFIAKAETRQVLGYTMRVARLEDVLTGKLWAYQDESRRGSKRQKDLTDISRLIEADPHLAGTLPDAVKRALE